MRRIDHGRPLRELLADRGLSLTDLARLTTGHDPQLRGLSPSHLGQMTSTGASGRDLFSARAALLVACALEVPVAALFEEAGALEAVPPRPLPPALSTGAPEPLHTAQTLAGEIGRSTWWVNRYAAGAGGRPPMPHYTDGRRRLYLYGEVLAWQRGRGV